MTGLVLVALAAGAGLVALDRSITWGWTAAALVLAATAAMAPGPVRARVAPLLLLVAGIAVVLLAAELA